ncbi:hypothetical protein [Pseudonocardia ailaonensis]|uniref:TIGR04086 family membrane protein n=1 Tax=Pseudonocardia ailaonensis TaxID=367279 RepID=UPI0031D36250
MSAGTPRSSQPVDPPPGEGRRDEDRGGIWRSGRHAAEDRAAAAGRHAPASGPRAADPDGSGQAAHGPAGSPDPSHGPAGSPDPSHGPAGSPDPSHGPAGSPDPEADPATRRIPVRHDDGGAPADLHRTGPQSTGPQDTRPPDTGPQGARPHMAGPQGVHPQGVYPHGAGQQGTGPQGAEPQSSGQQGSGPQGPESLVGSTVHDRSGAALGKVTKIVPGPDGSPWGVVRSRFGGSRTVPLEGATPGDRDGHVSVPVDRRTFRSAPAGGPDAETARHYTGRGALTAAHEYQHERFGGLKVGSAFFGWLVAVGLTVLLGALASLVVRLAGVSPALDAAPGQDPRMLGIAGGIVAVVVMLLAYFAGGYVAGRLARFDGARNGVAVWAMGVVVTVAISIATAVTATGTGLFAALRVPGIAVSGEALTLTGVIALLIAAAVALIGAVAGGKAGERYHRRVDRAAETALAP